MRDFKALNLGWTTNCPSKWEVQPLKNIFSFKKGKNAAKYTKEYVFDNKGEFPVYSGIHLCYQKHIQR